MTYDENNPVRNSLPVDLQAGLEMSPLEDVGKYIINHYLPSLATYTLIPEHITEQYFALVRRGFPWGEWDGDPRFLDNGNVLIQVYSRDPDGDERGALISEAIRTAFHRAWIENLEIPNRGWVVRATMWDEPTRKVDWTSSVGPVQYADLPSGFFRYESSYTVTVRKNLRRS